MPVNAQAQQFLDLVADAPPLDTRSIEQNREDLTQAIALTGPTRPLHSVTDQSVPGPAGPIPVRVYRTTDEPEPVVVYLHGGGWTLGTLDLADTTMRDLAHHAGACVVSVDYRLAPEHPFPAAYDDALAVTTHVLDARPLEGALQGVDAGRVAVAGDSAGGNLAAAVAQALRGRPALRHQGLVYPVVQTVVGSTPSYREFAEGHFLTARDMTYFLDGYAAGADRDDVRLAPSRATDLSGLAPATVVTAECDPLRDEGEAYAHALQAAGTPAQLRRFDGVVHPFLYMAGVIDDAVTAREHLGARLREALA